MDKLVVYHIYVCHKICYSDIMNWSYIAGFFDGEGSLTHHGKGFRITIPQTNEEVLKSIKKFVGCGNIIYIKKRKIHWSDGWSYYITKQTEVYGFIKKIEPFIIVKKGLIKNALPELKKILSNQRTKKKTYIYRKKEAKKLRGKGLTYRQIGKKLEVDWGYIRRLILDLN